MAQYILDACALITYLRDEPGTELLVASKQDIVCPMQTPRY